MSSSEIFLLLQNIDKIPLLDCPVLVIHVSFFRSFFLIRFRVYGLLVMEVSSGNRR